MIYIEEGLLKMSAPWEIFFQTFPLNFYLDIQIFKIGFKYFDIKYQIFNQVRQVYELHTDCTMRGVLPVHQGKNGEKYWYIPCIKFILFINTYKYYAQYR